MCDALPVYCSEIGALHADKTNRVLTSRCDVEFTGVKPRVGCSVNKRYSVRTMRRTCTKQYIHTQFVVSDVFYVFRFRSHFPFRSVAPECLYGFFGERFEFGFLHENNNKKTLLNNSLRVVNRVRHYAMDMKTRKRKPTDWIAVDFIRYGRPSSEIIQ